MTDDFVGRRAERFGEVIVVEGGRVRLVVSKRIKTAR